MSTTTWWPCSESRETFTLPSMTRYRLVDGWSWLEITWPLRYSRMVEHGKCASGSSKGRVGAYAIVLDAMGFLQRCTLPSVRVIEARRYRYYPEPANF